jgi:hypothetical protein
MGFNKRRLPEIDELKKIHQESNSDKEFMESVVGKSDALYGSVESMNYLDAVYENLLSKNGRQPKN